MTKHCVNKSSNACVAIPKGFRIDCEPNPQRATLRGFPFMITYCESAGAAQVLAIAHHKRRPNSDWKLLDVEGLIGYQAHFRGASPLRVIRRPFSPRNRRLFWWLRQR
jgi:hypothetical protein